MTAEQVARDFLNTFETQGVESAVPYLADNMTLTAVNPPITGGKMEFVGQGTLIKEALPDFKWNIQKATTMGDQVTLDVRWTGTHTGTLRLSAFMPGAPDVPATGKKVSVPDHAVFTVMNDQITAVVFDSPPGGGLPGFLQQLGIQM